MSGVSNERIVLQLLHVDQSDAVEVTLWGNKGVDLRHDGLNLDTFKARLQGAEGVTFGNRPVPSRKKKKFVQTTLQPPRHLGRECGHRPEHSKSVTGGPHAA